MPTESKAAQHLTFRPDLQGLRAVAILLVVLAHAGVPWFAGGFVGVDVFFVLSGYLITGLLVREFEQSGKISLIDFYARRLKRLLPALIVMVAGTVAMASWLLSPFEARAQLASAPYAATWTSNLYFLFSDFGYFDELASRDLFLHSWSLGVEEQFYLVWPLLLLSLFLAGPQRKVARSTRTQILFFAVVAITSLAFSLYLSSRWPHAAFYSMPSRIWQFSLGAIVYVAFSSKSARIASTVRTSQLGRPASWLALGAGSSLIIGSAVGLHPNLLYPGLWVLLPSLGTVLVIVAGYGLSAGHAGPLAHRSMVWLGDRSYSWYLWHWPILILGFSVGFEGEIMPSVGLVLLSLLAAILTYRFVELPFWKGNLSHSRPLHVVSLSLVAMTAMSVTSFNGLRYLQELEGAIEQTYRSRADLPEIYAQPCDAWYHHARVEPCVFGNKDADKTVVLLGDSIGVQWYSIVPKIFPASEWTIIIFTKSNCPMVDEDFYYARIGATFDVCTEWRNAVLDQLEQDQPDWVIMGSSANYEFTERQWVDGSRRVFNRLAQATGNVLVIPGTPRLGFDGPGCVTRNIRPGGDIGPHACVARDRLSTPLAVSSYLQQAAEPFPSVRVLDLNDLVCPGDVCSAMSEDGIVVFRDTMHLTNTYVRSRSDIIRERMTSLQSGLAVEE